MQKSLLLMAALLFFACNARQNRNADTIFVNGQVITVDSEFSVHQALAVKGNTILAVGTTDAIRKTAHLTTHIVDLRGKPVIPGFIEGHTHMQRAAFKPQNLPVMNSIKDILDHVRREAARVPAGTWIEVPKVFPTRLAEKRMPTRRELDSAAPRHPVLYDASYAMVLNSMGLKRCGLNPKSSGKTTDRNLIRDKVVRPEITFMEKVRGLERMQAEYLKNGLTSVFERASSLEDIRIIHTLDSLGRLIIRFNITHLVPLHSILKGVEPEQHAEKISNYLDGMEPLRAKNNSRIKFNTLKLLIDGGILSGTALMRKPWGKQKVFGITSDTYHGNQLSATPMVELITQEAYKRGYQATFHATGDSGVQIALNSYAKAGGDISKRRFQVTHGDFFGEDQMDQALKMGVILDAQWTWLHLDGPLMSEILPADRVRDFMPFGAWLKKGLIIGSGSDHMVGLDAHRSLNPYHPMTGLWVLATGKMKNGQTLGPRHFIGREAALKTFTINNAYMGFDEDTKGSIEPGKLADLVVLSGNYLTCPADSIRHLSVIMTVADGRIVYEKE